MTRNRFALPFAALLLFAGLSVSTAQPPARKGTEQPKSKAAPAAATVFEVYQDKGGSFRFRLKHCDDNLAIASKGYDTKAECMKVIDEIKKGAMRARVVDAPKDDDKP